MLPKDTTNKLPLCKHQVTLQDRGLGTQEDFYPQSAGEKTARKTVSLPNKG